MFLHMGTSVAFRWRFWKFQTYAEASWVLQKITEIQGCQHKTSGISGILGGPPTNLYTILDT